MDILHVGQNLGKDSIVGDIQMNRYAIFNGLERPRRIGPDLSVNLLGFDKPADLVSVTADATAGHLEASKWYGYAIAYASAKYVKPLTILDGSGNYTRGNVSNTKAGQSGLVDTSMAVVAKASTEAGVTHVLLYRTMAKSTEQEAKDGLLFFFGITENTPDGGGNVTFIDGVDASMVGMEAEQDNWPPPAYRYAANIRGHIFAGGSAALSEGLTCAVTNGSSTVTVDHDVIFDGVRGWEFNIKGEYAGGVNNGGLYYAYYVSSSTLQLVDALGTPKVYGGISGSGKQFSLQIPGSTLRWSKQYEPEAWPLENATTFSGNITGMIQIPNQPLLLVCTDEPSMYILDVNLISTSNFKTQRFSVSTTFSASSHYSLVNVEGKVRGIDAALGCIFEVDGTVVRDITKDSIPKIFRYLSKDLKVVKNWHCAYDQRQKIFGAFVTFNGSKRIIDICIGQNIVTGSWFLNHEKDLLCTGVYREPESGEFMVLGGTEGLKTTGAVWGRIWTPDVYTEWFPGGLRCGLVLTSPSVTSIKVDTTLGNLHTDNGGLTGRWVLVTDNDDRNAQLGYVLSNTADTIIFQTLIGAPTDSALFPRPELNWKFYVGLIECRWGPKLFDLGDPDIHKKVQELWCCVSGYDSVRRPWFRVFKGFNEEGSEQINLKEYRYLDKTALQTLGNQINNKMEPMPRFGVSWMDRSYGPTLLHSITVGFTSATVPQGTTNKVNV